MDVCIFLLPSTIYNIYNHTFSLCFYLRFLGRLSLYSFSRLSFTNPLRFFPTRSVNCIKPPFVMAFTW
jgi:hypothetical protein